MRTYKILIQKIYKEKPREICTSEDSKRFWLDGIAGNIIIRSTPEFIQSKLWGSKTAKAAWKLIEEICAGTKKNKENRFEVLNLKFQNIKQGTSESLEKLDFLFTKLMSEMASIRESKQYSNSDKIKTIVRSLNHNWEHTKYFYFNKGMPDIIPS